MAIRYYTAGILIFIALACTNASCKKLGLHCANNIYTFKIGVKAYPDFDSIHLGDIIWFEINTPSSLRDESSSTLINYSGSVNLGTAISFVKFIGGSASDPGALYDAKSFNDSVIIGSKVNNLQTDAVKEYLFSEINNSYKFKIAIIAKNKGTFSIGFSNAANVYRTPDNCTKAAFLINFKNTDHHVYFLEKNRPGYSVVGLELTNNYYFKVY